MAVVQSIQTKQFALESRITGVDADSAHRARIALAAMALRQGSSDSRTALVDVLEMLGLVDPPAAAAPVDSVLALSATS